jgi:ABC-type antimicrobial peptide transport system permease subunit
MTPYSPNRLLWIGFGLVLAGAILPFLMILQVLPASIGLCFVSFTASVVGLFLGLIGAAMSVKLSRSM